MFHPTLSIKHDYWGVDEVIDNPIPQALVLTGQISKVGAQYLEGYRDELGRDGGVKLRKIEAVFNTGD
jgi:hypothetical protein